ncbi:hypothetical protein [Streptomyces sp. CB03911]|uniref:hypothetical protein n=1 Tax=Streptomycetaceae TaxID=2062 RepID=UPI00093A6F40|nr:hypothetical protein [Streptomyces sp. CB03911]OKI13299.1 hypothetical protein A6A07_15455 [Streptomyces sp. CB03911]
MTTPPPAVLVRVGTLRVTARSAVEARLLADALPAALEQALRSWPEAAAPATGPRSDAAQRRAQQVATAIVEAARAGSGRGDPR